MDSRSRVNGSFTNTLSLTASNDPSYAIVLTDSIGTCVATANLIVTNPVFPHPTLAAPSMLVLARRSAPRWLPSLGPRRQNTGEDDPVWSGYQCDHISVFHVAKHCSASSDLGGCRIEVGRGPSA
ncbi:MAG: hypothetical protein U0176_14795 [Bacteroidia bacterium]